MLCLYQFYYPNNEKSFNVIIGSKIHLCCIKCPFEIQNAPLSISLVTTLLAYLYPTCKRLLWQMSYCRCGYIRTSSCDTCKRCTTAFTLHRVHSICGTTRTHTNSQQVRWRRAQSGPPVI